MNTIIIEKEKLLPIVKENKLKHDNIYNSAVEGYWQKCEEKLTKQLEKIKKHEKIDDYLGLAFPENHTNDYETVIQMLELGAENRIELTNIEFNAYVRNQWSWRNSFLGLNTSYITGCGYNPIVNNGEFIMASGAKVDF